MKYLKTTGIVLEKKIFNEGDFFVSIYSREYGKIDVFVKSGCKPKSKMAPSLNDFSVVEMMIVNGRNNFQLCGVKLIKHYWRLLDDDTLLNFVLLSYLKEFFQIFFKTDLKEEVVFEELEFFLDNLVKISEPKAKQVLFNQLIFRLLEILGYFSFETIKKTQKISARRIKFLKKILLSDPTRIKRLTKRRLHWLNDYLYQGLVKLSGQPIKTYQFLMNY